jgi:hypothetical protein
MASEIVVIMMLEEAFRYDSIHGLCTLSYVELSIQAHDTVPDDRIKTE